MNTIRANSLRYTVLVQVLAWTICAGLHAAPKNEIALRSSVGNACVQNSHCGSDLHCIEDKGTAKNGAKFSGGYCVRFDCSISLPCDPGSKCIVPEGEKFSVCLAACSSDSHCRNGYACHDDGVCLPANF